jgi:CRISPR/Cas system CMR-associated protein Cmr3 (group 5 of RAMP superfamily)
MSAQHIFIEPSDVWLFRNARPFAAGEQGRAVSLFPPTPRTIQGVIRSARLAQSGEPFDFRCWSPALQTEIGRPDDFGALRVRGPLVARRVGQDVLPFFPLPLDVTKLNGTWRILPPQQAQRFETNWHPALLPLLPASEGEPDKFEPGWLPGWLDPTTLKGQHNGVTVQLVAAAVGKPQPIGGRDIARGDRQREMHRAVPAGSVYFFTTPASASDVMDTFDGQCLSDVDAQIGLGLFYVGGW